MVEFKNPEVAAQFEALRAVDGKIHVPAGKKKSPEDKPVGYSGMLSGITLEAAEKALASGSNILKRKEGTPAKPAASEKVVKEKSKE